MKHKAVKRHKFPLEQMPAPARVPGSCPKTPLRASASTSKCPRKCRDPTVELLRTSAGTSKCHRKRWDPTVPAPASVLKVPGAHCP